MNWSVGYPSSRPGQYRIERLNNTGVVPHLMARNIGYRCPLCGRWLFRHVDFDLFPGEIVACLFTGFEPVSAFYCVLSGGKSPSEGYVFCDGRFAGERRVSLIRTRRGGESIDRVMAVSGLQRESRYVIIADADRSDQGSSYRVPAFVAFAASTQNVGFLVSVPKVYPLPFGFTRSVDFDRLNAFAASRDTPTRFVLS